MAASLGTTPARGHTAAGNMVSIHALLNARTHEEDTVPPGRCITGVRQGSPGEPPSPGIRQQTCAYHSVEGRIKCCRMLTNQSFSLQRSSPSIA